ncbi:MarR family winged helix-turn-helix transcriptional regulator [Spongisporangium articulatum]|uniref:MarR family winged helix-turn-helix transcriptional regulator n=1 Tax=Spongisporangium articulatum TaxID=3362603 RepID=A0ABW8AQC7_9ACTN
MSSVEQGVQAAELLLRVMKRMRRRVDDALTEHGLTLPRAKVLGALGDEGCPQAALAAHFDLAPRTVTELVDGLERAGYVERQPDPDDRRVRRVTLTDDGREAHDRAAHVRSTVMDQVFGDLPDEDLQNLIRILTRVNEHLDANPQPPPAQG